MAKTVKRRSYKNFKEKVDWSAVYYCDEVDHAVEVITNMFIEVLDRHAPVSLISKEICTGLAKLVRLLHS